RYRYLVFYYPSDVHRDLHSFPTRRSSDLWSALSRTAPDPTTVRFEIGLGSGSTIPTGLGTSVAVAPGSRHFAYITTDAATQRLLDRKSTRLNSSHVKISYAVFCLKKKTCD